MDKTNKRLIALMIATFTTIGSIISTVVTVEQASIVKRLNDELISKQNLLYSAVKNDMAIISASNESANSSIDEIDKILKEDSIIQNRYTSQINDLNYTKEQMKNAQKIGVASVSSLTINASAFAISTAMYTRNKEDNQDQQEINEARR